MSLYDSDIFINTKPVESIENKKPSVSSLYDNTLFDNISNIETDQTTESSNFFDGDLFESNPVTQKNYGLGYHYSIADLRKNDNVKKDWEYIYDKIIAEDPSQFRSLVESNSRDDMIEYFRDTQHSVTSSFNRAKHLQNWTEEDKKTYTRLRNAFQSAGSLGNTAERFRYAKDLSLDILGDPFNWLTVAAAVPTMGGSFTVNAAAQAAIRTGLSQGVKQNLKKEAIKNTGSIALYGAAEGSVWGGAYDFYSQEADKELGLQDGPIDWKRVGSIAALGGAFGAVVPGAIGGISNSLFLKKLFATSNEDSIYHQAARVAIDSERVLDVEMSDPSTKIVFFKNELGSKGRQTSGNQYEIVPLTRANYKKHVITKLNKNDPEVIAFYNDTFKVNNFREYLKNNNVTEDNAFLVLQHKVDSKGKKFTEIAPIKDEINLYQAVSKQDIETYFNDFGRKQYWKEVKSFRNKDAIKHMNTDDQSVEGLLYARQAGIPEDKIVELAKKYKIDMTDIDQAGYTYFRKLVEDDSTMDIVDVKLSILERLIAKTVGKATTRYLKLAENNDALVEYLESLVPGATNRIFKKRKKGVNEFTYGENKSSSDGFYLSQLDYALNLIGKTGRHAMLDPIENDQLLAMIVSGGQIRKYDGKPISNFVKEAYFGDGKQKLGIKRLLSKAFDEGDESGLFAFTGKTKHYFPHKLQHSKIANNRTEFEDMLIEFGYADPINDLGKPQKFYNSKGEELEGFLANERATDQKIWGRDFLFDAGEDIQRARELKATVIVDDILERRWTPYEQLSPNQVGGGHGFMKPRVFDKIPEDRMLPFIETDVRAVLQDYFVNFSQANVRTKMYGKNIKAMYEEGGIFRRIEDEFRAKGGDRTQVRAIMERLEHMHGLVTGLDHNVINNNTLRTVSDWGKLSQQMAHLPLATLSSLTEPLLLLSRARASDSFNVAYDIGRSMKKQTVRTFDRMAQASKRLKGDTTRGLKEFDDEEWREIFETGLALEQATMDRIEGLTGEALTGSVAKDVQNAFFKANILSQWTAAVQLAAFTTGKRLIKKNTESIYLHNQGIKKLSKKRLELYSDQLEELGVPVDQALAWHKKYLNKDGVFDEIKANKDIFYKRRIVKGANRFTREIILNPNTSSANRPLWFSSPAGQLLMQFAGYPTVFTNTVLKRFVNEATVYPLQTTPKILATTMLMTSVALMGNYIRTGGKNWEEQEPGELISHAIRRWGGYGAYEYFDKANTNLELGGGMAGSMLKTGGPLVGDAVDMLIYRKGLSEIATTNIPGYSALPKETRDYLKKTGRDKDKALKEFYLSIFGSEEGSTGFARGGIVDVPNAKDEPDEMINKLTGLPYNATSASVQDIEDRERRAKGSDGAEKAESFNAIKPLKNLVATIQGKVRELREGNKELLETTKDILESPSFRLYSDAVIKRKKEPITEDWFTDQEYATIKESLKSVFKHPQRRLDFYKSLKDQGKKLDKFQEPFPSPRAYIESKNINKDVDKVSMLFRWAYDGQTTKEGKPISLYETLGTSTLKIPYKQPYNSAVLEIHDKYDFNRQHGGTDGYLEQAKNIVKNMLSGNSYRVESGAMQLAEKYGAFVLPDDYTAEKENREPKFVPVNIIVPVSEIMDEDTWKNYQSSITYKQDEVTPTPDVRKERQPQERQPFKSGGVKGVVNRLIDEGGEALGVGSTEQRANEKQAAALVNQAVKDGLIPKYEAVPVDNYGFVLPANQGGRTGDVFNAVNHGLLSATYGDTMIRRGALQLKEVAQGFARPLDSKVDSYNNRVGFSIRENIKEPELINKELINRVIRSYEKMKSGEALIPGEDFFLNADEMEL